MKSDIEKTSDEASASHSHAEDLILRVLLRLILHAGILNKEGIGWISAHRTWVMPVQVLLGELHIVAALSFGFFEQLSDTLAVGFAFAVEVVGYAGVDWTA